MNIIYYTQGKKELVNIYIRLRDTNIDAKTSTKLKVNHKNFKKGTIRQIALPKNATTEIKQQLFKQNKYLEDLQTKLNALKKRITNAYNSKQEYDVINSNWLKGEVFNHFNPNADKLLLLNFEYWIENIINTAHTRRNGKKGIGLSESRVKAYKGLLITFKEFQGGKKIKVIEMNNSKFKEIKKWLFDVKEYSPSTAIKKLEDLKRVLKDAKENNIEVSKDYDIIKFQKVSTYDDDMDVIVLTLSDIEKIENANLVNDALVNARKWLILSCFTGQRGKDLITRIKDENFIERNGVLRIEIKQSKGNKKIIIPVLPRTKEIYNNGLPYIISMQKLNKHIKKVCMLAEVNDFVIGKLKEKTKNGKIRNVKKERPKYEYIATHTGRRTFATLHFHKLPNSVIMRVTGHKKLSTFLEYVNMQDEKHIDEFEKYYNQLEQKAKKQPNLRVVKDKAVNQ